MPDVRCRHARRASVSPTTRVDGRIGRRPVAQAGISASRRHVTELDPFYTETCGFDDFVTTKGHFSFKLYFDQDGNFKRAVGHPSMAHTYTSAYGSLETADRGVDKFTENPDGTLRVQGTGIHFKEPAGRARRACGS